MRMRNDQPWIWCSARLCFTLSSRFYDSLCAVLSQERSFGSVDPSPRSGGRPSQENDGGEKVARLLLLHGLSTFKVTHDSAIGAAVPAGAGQSLSALVASSVLLPALHSPECLVTWARMSRGILSEIVGPIGTQSPKEFKAIVEAASTQAERVILDCPSGV